MSYFPYRIDFILIVCHLFARYFVASSATRAALDMFFAKTLIFEDADINHSGDFGT